MHDIILLHPGHILMASFYERQDMSKDQIIFTSPKYAVKRTNHKTKTVAWLNLDMLFNTNNPTWAAVLSDDCICKYKITASEFTRIYREKNMNVNITFQVATFTLREHQNEDKNNIGYSFGFHA